MAYQRRDSGSGGYGGSKFGGAKKFGAKKFGNDSWDRGSRDSGGFSKQMFDAVCAQCGNNCQVPFKPNGRKPVMCSNCFVKDGDTGPKRFGARPSFASKGDMGADPFKQLNIKLDKILKMLEDVSDDLG